MLGKLMLLSLKYDNNLKFAILQLLPLQYTHNALHWFVYACIVFLTSDLGVEGDAHAAVGVVGLHGDFPCTSGTMTQTEGR